jgi:hypothetical protein
VPPTRGSQPVRRFGCPTAELKAMADGLKQCEIRTLALPSTGVYGVAVYDLLEVASRWLVGWAFASPPQSGLAWLCFLFAGWGSGADRASNDADVSTAPPKIP